MLLLAVLAASGCKSDPPAPGAAASGAMATASSTASLPASAYLPASAAASNAPPRASASAAVEREEPSETADAAGGAGSRFVIDEIADVGPPGPIAADVSGVVVATRSEELLVVRLEAAPGLTSMKPGKTRIGALTRAPSEFAALGRGPALLDGRAYWISKGRLVRRRFAEPGPVETLAGGARDGTRVSVARAGSAAAAAFIADAPSGLVARLWVEGHDVTELSADGTAANSVVLVSTKPDLVAISLESRTGMSPIHARRIEIKKDGAPKLKDDVVVWVGSSAQPSTELSAIATDSGVWAFLPIERDITHFGLARIDVGAEPRMNTEVAWRAYPNGLDPSPVASGMLCGEPVVLYVRPAEPRPRSPQELHVAALSAAGLGASQVVARARVFTEVSLGSSVNGALVAYVADRRTWAASVRCRSR